MPPHLKKNRESWKIEWKDVLNDAAVLHHLDIVFIMLVVVLLFENQPFSNYQISNRFVYMMTSNHACLLVAVTWVMIAALSRVCHASLSMMSLIILDAIWCSLV